MFPETREISKEYAAKFTIYQNRSLSIHGNQLFFLSMLCISFTIAFAFAWQGLWLILPFAGIEMLALGFALYFCINRLSRVETVTVAEKDVTICVRQRNKKQRSYSFPKTWTRAIVSPATSVIKKQRLYLGVHSPRIEIGAFLSSDEKYRLAEAINKTILKIS